MPRALMRALVRALMMVACAQPLCSPPALAQADPPTPTPTPTPAPAASTEQMLESTRDSVRSSTLWLARGVDSWFGDIPFDEGGKVSNGWLSMSLLKRQDQRAEFGLRLTAQFKLPNVEEHAYLFVGRDDPRDVVTDQPVAFSRQQRLLADRPVDQTFLAGLGLKLRDLLDLRIGVGGGIKPYVQARYHHTWTPGPADLVDFRETLFWTLSQHFGSTSVLSYEHALSSTLAARWLSAATISQESKNFEWSSSLGAYKSLGDQRLLSLEALLGGKLGTGVGVSDYGLQVKWEQPIYKNWLLGEIVGGHFWPRHDAQSERTRAWAIGLGLKMRF